MPKASNKPFPYLYKDRDRQDAVRWLLRVPGRKAVTIKGTYGTPDFAAAYRAALEGETALTPISKVPHGTIAALARSYLVSGDFATLKPATQRARRHLIDTYLIETFGKLPVAGLRPVHVREKIMDPLASKPGTARNVLSALRVLIARAIADGIIDSDPTVGIKRPKLSDEGWHSWTEAEIERFEAHYPIGTKARLAFALALYTGARAGNLVLMGRQHMKDGAISFRQEKTGKALVIPIHEDLKAVLDGSPMSEKHMHFLVSDWDRPFANANSFGHRMRLWAKNARLGGCPLHGIRKGCGRRLAEAGCSAHGIKSVLGVTLAVAEVYTKAADQKRMAEEAIARTESYTRRDQSYTRAKKA